MRRHNAKQDDGARATSPRAQLPQERASLTKSAVPAELLRLAGGALRDHDINEGRAAEAHRLVEGSAQVFRVFDKEALAAEGLHHPVVPGAVNQCVGL